VGLFEELDRQNRSQAPQRYRSHTIQDAATITRLKSFGICGPAMLFSSPEQYAEFLLSEISFIISHRLASLP
jgi:hypothetical protein